MRNRPTPSGRQSKTLLPLLSCACDEAYPPYRRWAAWKTYNQEPKKQSAAAEHVFSLLQTRPAPFRHQFFDLCDSVIDADIHHVSPVFFRRGVRFAGQAARPLLEIDTDLKRGHDRPGDCVPASRSARPRWQPTTRLRWLQGPATLNTTRCPRPTGLICKSGSRHNATRFVVVRSSALLSRPWVRVTRSLVGHSIERQSCSIFLVAHAHQIVPRINVSCPTEEEFLKRLECTRAQRINDAAEGNLHKKPLCSRDRY